MTQSKGYLQVREAAREILQSTEPSRSFHVGETHIVLSKVRVLESLEPIPALYAKLDLPPADDYGTWLK